MIFFLTYKENKRQYQQDVYIQIFFIKNYNNSQFIWELQHIFKCGEHLLKHIALVILVPTYIKIM